MESVATRPTASFTIFHRISSGDGGFTCDTCGLRRHGTFPRAADVFAVASQHLNLCRGALHNRPIEGVAIVNGTKHCAVLRNGIMIIALPTVFDHTNSAVRVVA